MTETGTIEAIAKRILGPMEAFKTGIAPPHGETDVIGVYDAPGGSGPVWVTPTRLLLPHDRSFERLHYSKICEVHGPETKVKAEPEFGQVRLILDDGRTTTLSIVGGRGRFCDAFEFARFLSRASKFARETTNTLKTVPELVP